MNIALALLALFGYFRIGHWIGNKQLQLWHAKKHSRADRFWCWLLFPACTHDNCLGYSDRAIISSFDPATYRKMMMFVWPLNACWCAAVLFILLLSLPFRAVLSIARICGVALFKALVQVPDLVHRSFITGPDVAWAAVKGAVLRRMRPRSLQSAEALPVTPAAISAGTEKR